ncbi:MAG: C4-type zinc ribbon domain-containing protein [Deltaproteobacteria bacterium]|nr:C4-type zinc ribbon domain-containing protein [Deltaproteobacteria bacterium]MCL5793036.1 C4-type zinc ribbon domain-containing protein [Deltaproteobacteria bacterium]
MDIEVLKQLQEIDLQQDTLLQEKIELEESLRKDFEESKEVQELIDALGKSFEQLESERKSKESEVQQTNEMIKRWDMRLKDASTGREYQAFMREINSAKKDISNMENTIMKLMEEIEQVNKNKEKEIKNLEIINNRLKQVKEKSEGRISFLTQKLNELESHRNSMSKGIEQNLLSMYEQIKKQRKIAIVNVSNGVCQGCYMNIPPQLYNEIMMNNRLIRCPHCQRILYYKAEEKVQKQKIKKSRKVV